MRGVEIVRRPGPSERQRIVDFIDHQTAVRGVRPLSDHLWLDLNRIDGEGDGLLAVTVLDGVDVIALAQMSAANDGSVLEVVVATDRASDPGDARRVFDDVVDTAVDSFARGGGGTLTWWLDDADDHTVQLAGRLGLEPSRALHEMRRPLPHPDHSEVATRAFDPTTDAEAWVAVNNRAFAGHGEQGGWTVETLRLRIDEPWFDADGFRIHEIDGSLAAFCWTKVHDETDPPIGEIYVIAVDPAFHSRGLGRQLTLAGLDWLAGSGLTVANLYVDAANTAAVRLYERLGFGVHRTRQAFTGTLDPR